MGYSVYFYVGFRSGALGLRVTSYGLCITSYGLRITSYESLLCEVIVMCLYHSNGIRVANTRLFQRQPSHETKVV